MKTIVLHRGLTTVRIEEDRTVISHLGNMGNCIEHVRRNVDELLGEGYFDQAAKNGYYHNDGRNVHSDPAYSFILTVENGSEQ